MTSLEEVFGVVVVMLVGWATTSEGIGWVIMGLGALWFLRIIGVLGGRASP